MDKLKMVLKKVFGRFGDIVTEYYPADESGVFKGYVSYCRELACDLHVHMHGFVESSHMHVHVRIYSCYSAISSWSLPPLSRRPVP